MGKIRAGTPLGSCGLAQLSYGRFHNPVTKQQSHRMPPSADVRHIGRLSRITPEHTILQSMRCNREGRCSSRWDARPDRAEGSEHHVGKFSPIRLGVSALPAQRRGDEAMQAVQLGLVQITVLFFGEIARGDFSAKESRLNSQGGEDTLNVALLTQGNFPAPRPGVFTAMPV